MNEKPIIFSGEMVRAILTCDKCGKSSVKFPCEHCGNEDFKKTETRRVINPQPPLINQLNFQYPPGQYEKAINPKNNIWFFITKTIKPDNNSSGRRVISKPYKCPFGVVGDLLWVREKWRVHQSLDKHKPSDFKGWSVGYADGGLLKAGVGDTKFGEDGGRDGLCRNGRPGFGLKSRAFGSSACRG